MATQLSRTFSAQGNQRKFTISFWVKRTKLSYQCALWGSGGSGTYASSMFFSSDDTLRMWNYFAGSYAGRKYSSAKYRDTNGWYHIVARVDTASSTASERMRMYVNGEEVTALSQSDNPSQNVTFEIGHTGTHYIGGYGTGAEAELLMSHYHYCDGQSYAPTEFGETDSTTGEWKIKTDTSVSYGTSGSFILEDGNSVTDQSGLGNNWTVANGTLTKTEDNPSNVFATMNPLAKFRSGATLTQGNNTVATTNSKAGVVSTLGIPSDKGKFYVELKMSTLPVDARFHFGLSPFECVDADDPINANNLGIMISGYNAAIYAGGGNINAFYGGVGRFNSFTGILGMAVDLTSSTKTIAFSKDGAWITGDNTTSTDFSNALKVDITSYLSISSHWNVGAGSGNSTGTTGVYNMNFGNGYFGTTAVASAGTNASGNGIFEYDVPTGYTALSTKGLNL